MTGTRAFHLTSSRCHSRKSLIARALTSMPLATSRISPRSQDLLRSLAVSHLATSRILAVSHLAASRVLMGVPMGASRILAVSKVLMDVAVAASSKILAGSPMGISRILVGSHLATSRILAASHLATSPVCLLLMVAWGNILANRAASTTSRILTASLILVSKDLGIRISPISLLLPIRQRPRFHSRTLGCHKPRLDRTRVSVRETLDRINLDLVRTRYLFQTVAIWDSNEARMSGCANHV